MEALVKVETVLLLFCISSLLVPTVITTASDALQLELVSVSGSQSQYYEEGSGEKPCPEVSSWNATFRNSANFLYQIFNLIGQMFRHGDRSPVGTFPKDLYADYWPQGFGQLSKTGMEQEYNLGGLLKRTYMNDTTHPGFLAENYTRKQIYIRSTDYDRTLMSAESLLAALYPPDEDERFVQDLPWQPIPVHTVPQPEDRLLRAQSINCPKYKELREADKQTEEYKMVELQNKDFFTRLELLSGYEAVNLTNIWYLEDIIFVENTTGLPLPDWDLPSDLDKMQELADFALTLMFNSREKNRLTAGNWLQKLLADMTGKSTGNESFTDIKFFLYSAHDTTVASMMSALGVFNGLQPSYSTAFFVELLSDGNEHYFVRLLFRNVTDSDEILLLNIDSCRNPNLCSLEEFQQLVEPLIPSDWEMECGLGQSGFGSGNSMAFVFGILFGITGVTLIILVAVLAFLYCQRKKMIKYIYLVNKDP